MKPKTFQIYFSDLNEDAKRRLLDFVGIKDVADANWDMDIIPIAVFDLETISE